MKKPTVHKKLSLKEILRRHKLNLQDQELHKIIESEWDDTVKEKFSKLLERSTKQEPFNKKK